MDNFKKAIKEYLDKRADEDELFRSSYANEKKSIDKCCDYIVTTVKETGREVFTNDEIYGMAIHYYDESNPGKIDSRIRKSCIIKISSEDLSKEAHEAARRQAFNNLVAKEEQEIKRIYEKQPVKKAEEELPTLF